MTDDYPPMCLIRRGRTAATLIVHDPTNPLHGGTLALTVPTALRVVEELEAWIAEDHTETPSDDPWAATAAAAGDDYGPRPF